MSGIVIRLAQKSDYSLTTVGNTNLAQSYIIGRRLDASRYQNGIIVMRLHTITSFVSGQAVSVQWVADGFTDDDPSINWTQTQQNATTPACTMTGGTDVAGTVKYGTLTAAGTPFPPLLMFQFSFTSTVATALKISLSCDLCLKGD